MAAITEEEITGIICRGTSACIPPAEFKLYNLIGKDYAGKQYVPVYPSFTRTLRNAQTRRADTRKVDEECKKKQTLQMMIERVNAKPTFLDIAPMYDGNVASTDLITETSTSDVVVGDISDEDLNGSFMSWAL